MSFLEEGETYKGLEALKECAEFGESGQFCVTGMKMKTVLEGMARDKVGVGVGEVGAVCEEPCLPCCVACGLDFVGQGEPCR